MRIRSLLLLLIIFFSSCEKYITIPIPEASNKPVLNLLINKDSIMLARVTLSNRLSGNQSIPEVQNAVVNLYENGALKEKLAPYELEGRLYYRGNTLPKAGATYRVTAAIPGYEEVSGNDQVPDTVKIGEMRMTIARINSYAIRANITLQLHDDGAVQNYYRIRIYQLNEYVDSNGNGWRQKILQYFETEEADLALFDDNMKSEFYVTDALFNGRSPRFTFRANAGDDFKKMIVEVTTLTYHSYNYLNSAFMAREKNEDGLSEKVMVYNNIVNGLGIVGGVAQREYEVVR